MVSAKPKVQLPDSGLEKPKVHCSDFGQGIPEFNSRTRTKKDKAASKRKISEEGETQPQEPSFHSEGATEKKGARPAFEALPPRHPTPAQIDAAIADAWTRFEALDDPRDPEAWG